VDHVARATAARHLTASELLYGGAVTPVRLAYLGTPALAVPPLHALVDAGHEVALVVTRDDRRRGRGSGTAPSPVKAAAIELGLPVTHTLGDVADAGVELGVVVAYGRIIPAGLLQRVPMVNLHFSLLPRWRGAAPVERAILAGDTETGVCVMAVDETLDTGPVYASEAVAIGPDEGLEELRGRLVAIGSRLLVGVLAGGAAHLPEPRPQAGEATYAEKILPHELELRWDRPAGELARVVRLGRAWTSFRARRLGVLDAGAVTGPAPGGPGAAGEPGTLVDGGVVCGGGTVLALRLVQPEGRRPMAFDDWVRGARPVPGERLDQ
jgi:methionyl-tRNA formyltransferase